MHSPRPGSAGFLAALLAVSITASLLSAPLQPSAGEVDDGFISRERLRNTSMGPAMPLSMDPRQLATAAAHRPAAAYRPWTYWWWMGSAVDRTNITRELTRFRDAGFGGAHVIPIYGAKGWEDRTLDYLSNDWMEMLDHTVNEANRLGLGIDMTTGTGWCFGGPRVSAKEANAAVVSKVYEVKAGQSLDEPFDRSSIQALAAYGPEQACVELTDRIATDGTLAWRAAGGPWQVYAISQRPSGQKVKRAAPGGTGHMLNPFYAPAMRTHLNWFDEVFGNYQGALPRAMYHDSYEYRSDWSPDLFEAFEKRRGYRLQTELPALLRDDTSDRAARVKGDYRETLSDLMIEVTLPMWQRWSADHGFLTRNEAHGSPGNLLDLYALADIPETEMFHLDRSKLVSKFASSAAHVAGHRRVSAETGTWLKEHFTETLDDLKGLVDDLFLSGVNHVVYHGSCYSPDEAGWPGWLFYASTQMNARNPIWRDVPALNAYIAHIQSLLAADLPDHDILLYWPIHDRWHNPKGLAERFTVHARDWLEEQPIGRAARRLWNRGYTFDYISDRQVSTTTAKANAIEVTGGRYRVIVVPSCELIPIPTFSHLLDLARSGATILFEKHLPGDVPGLGELEQRRTRFRELQSTVPLRSNPGGIQEARLGTGRILVGDLEAMLSASAVARESLVDHPGLMFLRRKSAAAQPNAGTDTSTPRAYPSERLAELVPPRASEVSIHTPQHEAPPHDWLYFIVNTGEDPVNDWVPLARDVRSATLARWTSSGAESQTAAVQTHDGPRVYLQLEPGESVVVRGSKTADRSASAQEYVRATGTPQAIQGEWEVAFLAGGPTLPNSTTTPTLGSWTSLGDETTERFAGTALYSATFDAPSESASTWRLDLGRVAQSARVRLNGRELGTAFTKPFRFRVEGIRQKGNKLELEVTSTAANRIRDLDRRKVEWRTFHDINFVNIDYKQFDASAWPVADAGLLGPVTLTPLETFDPIHP